MHIANSKLTEEYIKTVRHQLSGEQLISNVDVKLPDNSKANNSA